MAFHNSKIIARNRLLLPAFLFAATGNAHAAVQPAGTCGRMPFDDAGNAVCAEVDSAAAGDSSRCANHAGSAAAEKALRMTYVSVPLITGALLLKGEDTHFRNMRGEHIPKTYKRNETYIQYLPLAVTLGLKAFGVESRSSWARMAVSGAAGGAIMLAATQSMKHLISTGRPDNSDDHSFPSGHTATAFVTATILHREYGHLHPLVSIGGYATAAATGILRIRKNRHWASDVAAGAGIGILATELGYCITDALFRNKGLDITGRKDIISNRGYKPSFVGIRTGFNVPLGNFRLNDMLDFRTSGGYCAAVEGAYFANTHIGIGGKIGTASCNIITNGRQAEPDRLELLNASAGVYASCPVSKRWLAGTKLTAGFVHYGNLYLASQTVDGGNGFGAGTGLSFTFRARKDMSVCFSADYDLLPPVSKSGGQYFHMLTLGVATAWNF